MNLRQLIGLSLFFAASVAYPMPSVSIGYQGKLLLRADTAGTERLDQPHEVRFYLYRTEQGGEPVWARAVSVTPDDEGNFATVLNDAEGTALPEFPAALESVLGSAEADAGLWLTFAVGRTESGQLAPRQRLRPLRKAHVAHSAERGKAGFRVSGTLTAHTFEVSGTATFQAPVSCRVLTVASEEALAVPGDLHLNRGISLLGGKLSSDTQINLGEQTVCADFFPIGTIVMWSGSTSDIPAGWKLCDGANGTPDLRGRFLRGAKGDVGAIGGEERHSLTEGEMAAHNHWVSYDIAAKTDVSLFWVSFGAKNAVERTWTNTSSFTRTTEKQHNLEVASHENMPQYWALCFIQRCS